MKNVIVRFCALRKPRTLGTKRARYEGSDSHFESPCVFMYDHLLSRSRDRLAMGLSDFIFVSSPVCRVKYYTFDIIPLPYCDLQLNLLMRYDHHLADITISSTLSP